MQDTQVNTFNGGLDFDSDLRSIKTDRYVDALNVETMSIEKNGINAITPMKSSSLAFSVPDIFDEVQFTKLKYEEDVNINFYFYGADGALLGQGFIPAAINTDFAAFEVAFTTAMFNYGYDVADFDLSANGEYFLSSIEFGSQPVRVSFLWQVDGEYYDEIVVQEAYVSSKLRPIATSNVENRLFVFSSTGNSNAIEIGIATKNVTWSYTRIFRTWRFLLPTTEAIDIRVEKVSNQSWAVYWTDNTNKPKVLYIPEAYTEDCVAKYTLSSWETPTSGYIIYNEANEQTNLQLINNAGLVTYSDQLQAGGNLRSGGYRYSVRFGVNGTENTTEWSVLTPNVIPVFEASINSASAYIKVQGEKGGVATSKANVLLIQNALPNIYNFVELACVYNSGGANSASIVGRFDVTSSEFTVTHTGFEQGVIEFSTDLLPQTEPVILKAKSLEIKKNRLNLANLEIGADDPVLAAIASAATISQVKEELTQVGKIGSGGLLDVSASFLAPVEYTFAMYSPVTTAPDLIFNVENKDVNGEYNPTTGVFTKLGSPAQIKISMGISYTIGVSGRIGFIIMKNGVFYAYAQTGRIAAGSSTLPFDVMSYFSNNVINFNGTPLNVNDTISFKIWWQPDSVDPADKIIIIPTGSFLNIVTTNAQGDFSLSRVGEYQLPENCATKVGYMLNETYPFFMRFHYKNGYISSPYYIDSYTFNDDNSGQLYNDALENYTYSYGAVVSNINISSVKDRINGVSIWRGECNPTVLGSGVYFNSDDFTSDYYIVGEYAGIPQGNNRYALLYNSTNDRRKFGLFFSHDTRIEKTGYIDGAYLKLYGAPKPFNSLSGITNGSNIASYAEYLGVQTTSYESSNNTIIDAYYNDFSTLGATKLENTAILGYKPNTDHTKGSTGNLEGIAMTVSNFVNSNHGSDNGVYMAQYIRPIAGSQYDLNSINIVPTGTYLNTNKIPSGIAPNLRVFGGDTYTQKNILKVRYWSTFDNVTIRSSFITYYAQQKINTQMFFCDENETVKFTRNLQGWKSINDYLFPFKESEDVAEEQFNYDRGFSAQYPLRLTAYNPNLPAESKFISRIHYSQQKPINSLQDFYRKIGAFDFRDLDTKNGNIAAIRDVNNYMVAIQPRAISVLPYLSDVALTSQGGGQVLVGTGGVYNQRENIISTYGTSLQTCTLVGNNNNGNSTLYWFSPEFKKYCRYGGDGIKVLSDDNSMRSFFLTMDAQAEYDMVQVFDIEHASVIMTWGGAQSKTLFFNEKSNNFSSFASFIPLRYFPYQNITLAPRISATDYNQIYELSGGTNYLSYLGAAPSVFRIEYVANKGGMSSKRFLSAALSVGEGYTFTNPAVSMSVNGDVVFPHTITTFQKRHDNWFGAFNKAAGKQPIGQYGVVKVESSAYIVILGAVTKFRNIFRSLFK
jgi:hypothetical protein